ncbi:MAG: hypothetical protein B6244_14920 [Candidatus Cloacimonetes bacterium 4572_55]|nr:MAG: hypothetical protein B6244_14920 [Candidatus Cloacimonetes bacterium 4572_55]
MANKTRRCTFCKDYFPADGGIVLPAGFFCSFDHAAEYAKKKQDKLKEKRRKQQKKTDKTKRDSLKTVRDLMPEAQAAFNKYIRARDYGLPCISCGATPKQKVGGTVDAGHYRSRGSAGHLRFNVWNCHSQCVLCNRYQSGNVVDYRINLIKKIGVERVETLENDNDPRKFSVEYLRRVKRIFNKRARIVLKRK